MVTSAFGTAAPCGSRTVPLMLPTVLVWALAAARQAEHQHEQRDFKTEYLFHVSDLLASSGGSPELANGLSAWSALTKMRRRNPRVGSGKSLLPGTPPSGREQLSLVAAREKMT